MEINEQNSRLPIAVWGFSIVDWRGEPEVRRSIIENEFHEAREGGMRNPEEAFGIGVEAGGGAWSESSGLWGWRCGE